MSELCSIWLINLANYQLTSERTNGRMDERGSPRLGCCLPDHVWICLVKIGHARYVAHWTLEGARLNKAAYPCLLFIALHAIAGCIEPLSWNIIMGLGWIFFSCFVFSVGRFAFFLNVHAVIQFGKNPS